MEGKGAYYEDVAITAAVGTTGGGLLSKANPEGVDLIITRAVVDVTEASDAAGTFNLGIAADGVTGADNLIDGGDFNADAALDNIINKGSNGKELLRWPSGSYLTMTKATGATSAEIGLEARVFVEYIRA